MDILNTEVPEVFDFDKYENSSDELEAVRTRLEGIHRLFAAAEATGSSRNYDAQRQAEVMKYDAVNKYMNFAR